MDTSIYLEDFIASVETLPSEIQHLLTEIGTKGQEYSHIHGQIDVDDRTLDKIVKPASFTKPEDDELGLIDQVKGTVKSADAVLDHQILLAKRGTLILERAIKRLDTDLSRISGQPLPQSSSSDLYDMSTSATSLSYSPFARTMSTSGELGGDFVLTTISAGSPLHSQTQPPPLPTPSPERRKKTGRKPVPGSPANNLSLPEIPSGPSNSPQMPLNKGRKSMLIHEAGGEGSPGFTGGARRRDGSPKSDGDAQVYCYCQQPSFGNMVACDGNTCTLEWFHYECVGLVEPPTGKWFCEECGGPPANRSATFGRNVRRRR